MAKSLRIRKNFPEFLKIQKKIAKTPKNPFFSPDL